MKSFEYNVSLEHPRPYNTHVGQLGIWISQWDSTPESPADPQDSARSVWFRTSTLRHWRRRRSVWKSREFLGKSIWEKSELFRWYLSDPFSLGLSIPESCFSVNLHRLAPHWKSWWLHTSFNLYCTSCSISLHCLIPFLPKWVHSRWQRTTWSGSCRLSAMSDRLRSVRFRKHIVERFKTPWTLLGPNPRNVGTFRST